MFATFRPNQDKGSLDTVRQTNDPPIPTREPFDACRRCREKKLKCTGEKNGCDRCLANELQCIYPGRRQNSLARTGKRKCFSMPDSEVQRSVGRRRSLPRTPGHSQSVTPPTYPDESASTASNEMAKLDDKSWQIEAMQTPVSPRVIHGLSPVDAMSSWSMVNGDRDHISSLCDQSHIQLDPTDGLAMNCDVDIDEFLPMPGILSSDARPLYASPTNMSIEIGQDTQQKDCSSALLLQNFNHARPSPPIQNQTKKPSSSSQSLLTDHQCTADALRVLEASMAGLKAQATVKDLLRSLANTKSSAQSLAKLAKCSMCMKCSPFLALMVININALLDAVDTALKLLRSHDIRAEASVWKQYGVDTVEEFGSMYSPLLLPIVGALRRVISEIYQVCLTQNLQPQLETLGEGRKRLGSIEMGIQTLL